MEREFQVIRAPYLGSYPAASRTLRQAMTLYGRARSHACLELTALRRRAADRLRRLRVRVRRAGFEEGRREGERTVLEKLIELERNNLSVIEQMNRDCLELALTIARQVLECEISNSVGLATRISSGIERLSSRSSLRIALHPGDLEAARGAFPDRLFFEDPSIARGAIRFETPAGVLTLDWRERFTGIVDTLRASLEQKLSAPVDHGEGWHATA